MPSKLTKQQKRALTSICKGTVGAYECAETTCFLGLHTKTARTLQKLGYLLVPILPRGCTAACALTRKGKEACAEFHTKQKPASTEE